MLKAKIYYLFLAAILIGSSCSEDLSLGQNENNSEGTLNLTLEFPKPDIVQTRGDKEGTRDERIIKDLTVFVFNNQGSKLYAKTFESTDFTPDDSQQDYKVTLNNIQVSGANDGSTVYVVANGKNQLGDLSSLNSKNAIEEKTKALVSGKVEESPSYNFIMSGKGNVVPSTSGLSASVQVKRTTSKITMELDMEQFKQSDFIFKGFEVHNAAPKCYVGANTNEGSCIDLPADVRR